MGEIIWYYSVYILGFRTHQNLLFSIFSVPLSRLHMLPFRPHPGSHFLLETFASTTLLLPPRLQLLSSVLSVFCAYLTLALTTHIITYMSVSPIWICDSRDASFSGAATLHMWLLQFKLITLNAIKNSISQGHWPHLKCPVATCDWKLPSWTAQIKNRSITKEVGQDNTVWEDKYCVSPVTSSPRTAAFLRWSLPSEPQSKTVEWLLSQFFQKWYITETIPYA